MAYQELSNTDRGRLVRLKRLVREKGLSHMDDFERSFSEDMVRRFQKYGWTTQVSPKQSNRMLEILEKHDDRP